MVKLQMLKMKWTSTSKISTVCAFKNPSKKFVERLLKNCFLFCLLDFPLHISHVSCFSFVCFVLSLDLCVRSVFPFWIFLVILTCFLIFGEFESKNLLIKPYIGSDLDTIGRKGWVKKDFEDVEYYLKAKLWSSFESRKGFGVSSYVGVFLLGFENFFLINDP